MRRMEEALAAPAAAAVAAGAPRQWVGRALFLHAPHQLLTVSGKWTVR
ncbi:hypothetical protein E2C01_005824 [Portunus trituberculatus]|uniref:Uncharacterized protein n=1 Tax=Portunus trituberculatus TaxID=210409 RepID=A0A5B7CWH5_PORTR|nr:hypothetical protein [Portunus trituberculatus]